jgi:hypothetical protein
VRIRRIREAWGIWEKRNEVLIYHPINQRNPGTIHDAYVNLVLSVQISTHSTEWGPVTHLWVKRHDEQPLIWRDMQRVKNELVGAGRVGIEVFPAQADVVDAANMFHIWVLPEGFQLPFSLER